ncbi:glycosyltransferase family 2 protein [Paracnuella aquatica]|uniref:glycosyltransferase family 2 protein n=1 Tax=Paracnuella aquatica TaxID=2268757 RepID=UPI00139017B5|nr:glycosyltransferase [Paracnuella aquatica]
MISLTVVLPVYNGLPFLTAAVNSVLQQTFTDFEFIIIDDCSTDGSYELLQTYTDPRIRLFRNEANSGISFTLNRGIALAQTDWIVRMDSDDICRPNRLEQQAKFIQQHPDGALYSCDVQKINEQGAPISSDRFDTQFYFYHLHFFCIVYHPAVVMRKSAVQEIGGYTVPYAEDWELFWQLSRKYKMYHQPEVLLDYRVSSKSLHQVVRKKEYAAAQMEQLMRNLHSVTHPRLQVPQSHLYCLQHYYEPLEAEGNIRSIAACLHTLDVISEGIAAQPNPNNDPAITKQAAASKKRFILEHFMRSLPGPKAVALLVLLGEWAYLWDRLTSRLPFSKAQ